MHGREVGSRRATKNRHIMSIFETVGMAYIIFTSSLASIAIAYLTYVGVRVVLRSAHNEEHTKPDTKETGKMVASGRR